MNHKITFEPKKNLCALDFSELSNLALKYAAVGAREYGAKLTVLHAEAFELPRYFSGRETDHLVQELAAAKQAVRTDLADHVKRTLGSVEKGLTVEYAVSETHPANNVFRQNHRSSNTACNGTGAGRSSIFSILNFRAMPAFGGVVVSLEATYFLRRR